MSDVISMADWLRQRGRGQAVSTEPKDHSPTCPENDDSNAEDVVQFRASAPDTTDIGNAELFAEQWGGVVRFIGGRGWIIYDGKRWALDRQEQIMTLAIHVVKESIANPDWRKKSQARVSGHRAA